MVQRLPIVDHFMAEFDSKIRQDSCGVSEAQFADLVRRLLNAPPQHKPAKKAQKLKRRAFR